MPETEEQSSKKNEAKIGKEPSRLVAALMRTTLSIEAEPREPFEVFKKDFPPYFKEVKLEASLVISVTEVKLKGEPEGKDENEKKMGVLNRIWDKIIAEGLIQAALGISADGSLALRPGGWEFGKASESEGWTPEFKKSANKPRSFEVNIHDNWKFPDAKPVPIDLQIALIGGAYDQKEKKWKCMALQGEGTVTGLELTNFHEGKDLVAEGIKLITSNWARRCGRRASPWQKRPGPTSRKGLGRRSPGRTRT